MRGAYSVIPFVNHLLNVDHGSINFLIKNNNNHFTAPVSFYAGFLHNYYVLLSSSIEKIK
jgi:hypothetical protein